MQKSYKFVYFGTPSFSTLVLDALFQASFVPALIVTAADKPKGRGLTLSQSPVKKWAQAHSIPVLQPEKLDSDFILHLASYTFDLFIVAAYGKILPQAVLDLPAKGAVNVHPSLLPRYRGMSPVESQILADEPEVGVSIILMDAKMDHGPILAQEKVAIPEWPIDRNTVNEILWKAGGTLLVSLLPDWLTGMITPSPQNESEATVTKKIVKEDGLLDFASDARANYLTYLAYNGWPGTYFFEGTKRMKITKASFTNDVFIIERVIPEGKPEINFQSATSA